MSVVNSLKFSLVFAAFVACLLYTSPVINRIVKYNAVAVTGKVDTKATGVSGYGVLFENQTNGVQLNAQVNADGTYTAYLLSLIHIL